MFVRDVCLVIKYSLAEYVKVWSFFSWNFIIGRLPMFVPRIYTTIAQSQWFLPRDAMHARYMLWPCVCPSVRLSVCLSVTSRSSTKTAKCRITIITHVVLQTHVVVLPSVLWRCWLGGRKGIRPVKTLSGGVLAWLSVWSEVQTCIWPSWCHCHSLSLASVKSRLVLPFWHRLTRVVPKKGR